MGCEERIAELEAALEYSASCFHVAIHGVREAPTFLECDKPTCKAALRALRGSPNPSTDATQHRSP